MRVWLDDRRAPPSPDWRWVTTPDQVIALLQTGEVEEVSLDHDLSLFTDQGEVTGIAVLDWLEQQLGTGNWPHPLPELHAHTSNPAAHKRMELAIASIQRLSSGLGNSR